MSPLRGFEPEAVHSLSKHFQSFFGRPNPSPAFEKTAASQHNTIRGLIEDRSGPAAELAPITFLQGSYKQQTAIYTINDVDIVVLCNLWYPGSPGGFGKSYGRDDVGCSSPLATERRGIRTCYSSESSGLCFGRSVSSNPWRLVELFEMS
jgi:hypothetical protein